MALRALSLCAGVGGIDLALRPYARTVCYVEREAFPAAVLVARMEDGGLDPAPIWSDLKTFDAAAWRGSVDLVTGGYPCQPFSVAGKQLGAADPRHLWPDVLRVLVESQAPFAFFENVRGHVSKGLREVLEDLASFGFSAEWDVFSAGEEGAPHRRERLFIFAYSRGAALRQQSGRGKRKNGQGSPLTGGNGEGEPLADSDVNAGHERGPGDAQQGPRGWDACGGGERSDVADSNGQGQPQQSGPKREERRRTSDGCEPLASENARHPEGLRRKEHERGQPDATNQRCERVAGAHPSWATEPNVGRVAHGVASRVDRLRACGNGVVPATARRAWLELTERAGLS